MLHSHALVGYSVSLRSAVFTLHSQVVRLKSLRSTLHVDYRYTNYYMVNRTHNMIVLCGSWLLSAGMIFSTIMTIKLLSSILTAPQWSILTSNSYKSEPKCIIKYNYSSFH